MEDLLKIFNKDYVLKTKKRIDNVIDDINRDECECSLYKYHLGIIGSEEEIFILLQLGGGDREITISEKSLKLRIVYKGYIFPNELQLLVELHKIVKELNHNKIQKMEEK